jgi:hypothetical protein
MVSHHAMEFPFNLSQLATASKAGGDKGKHSESKTGPISSFREEDRFSGTPWLMGVPPQVTNAVAKVHGQADEIRSWNLLKLVRRLTLNPLSGHLNLRVFLLLVPETLFTVSCSLVFRRSRPEDGRIFSTMTGPFHNGFLWFDLSISSGLFATGAVGIVEHI